jgi:dihydropteroate synthase
VRPAPAGGAPWRFAWCGGPVWDASGGTRIVAIVNVTPDSFTDGGRFLAPEAAADHAVRLVAEGADALDVGAESTRPGHEPVDPEAEWCRLAPALARVRAAVDVPVSVDTRHAAVARRALDAGAQAINDVSGLGDPEMAALVGRTGSAVIVGHWRPRPPDRTWHAARVAADLAAARERLLRAGVAGERIALDPGLGFGKGAEDNWRIVAGLDTLVGLGSAVMVGASRKRFALAGAEGAGPAAADEIAGHLSLWCALRGTAMVRVHAPAPSRRALAIARALAAAEGG